MAEGILRSMIPSELSGQVVVRSAGTMAMTGSPATALAVETAAEHGIDIQSHKATLLEAELLLESDLILCMERAHAAAARRIAPGASERIHMVTRPAIEAGDRVDADVQDPIGGAQAEYEKTFSRIESYLTRWLPYIRQAAGRSEGVR